jgi:hypothetical protein
MMLFWPILHTHYLRLANASPRPHGLSRHPMKYPIIADSGANYHMFKEREFFSNITPTSGTVLLGDGKTRILIEGVAMLYR